jgi:hypothetical protein
MQGRVEDVGYRRRRIRLVVWCFRLDEAHVDILRVCELVLIECVVFYSCAYPIRLNV